MRCSTSSSSGWPGRPRSCRSGRRASCARSAGRSSTPTRTSACRDTSRWRATRARSSSSASDIPDGGWYVGPDDRRHRRPAGTGRDRRDLRTGARRAARRRLRPRARARQRHRLRAHRRRVLALAVAHPPRARDSARRQRVRESGHHRRARRPSAVRRLRAVRRRFQGRRARLPAPVRRTARGHREHRSGRASPGRAGSERTSSPSRRWAESADRSAVPVRASCGGHSSTQWRST